LVAAVLVECQTPLGVPQQLFVLRVPAVVEDSVTLLTPTVVEKVDLVVVVVKEIPPAAVEIFQQLHHHKEIMAVVAQVFQA
jgi:hypothetical protein